MPLTSGLQETACYFACTGSRKQFHNSVKGKPQVRNFGNLLAFVLYLGIIQRSWRIALIIKYIAVDSWHLRLTLL